MDTAGQALVGDDVSAVARCGAVLIGPVGGDEACGGAWARLLVGAAFRHLWAVGAGRLPEDGALPACVRRPAGALLADFAASPDDGARAAGAVLSGLAEDARTWDGVSRCAGVGLAWVEHDGA